MTIVSNVVTYQGDDYYDVDGRALLWTDTDSEWPTISGASINAIVNGVVSFPCTIIDEDNIMCELSASGTLTVPIKNFPHPYQVIATLINNHIVTLVDGHWTSKVKRTV